MNTPRVLPPGSVVCYEVGDRLTGCSIERARLIISQIAKFHATWWNHPEVPHYSGKYTQDAILNWQGLYIREANRLDDIPEIPGDPELVRAIKELSPQLAKTMNHQRKSPYTLIHHDYHLGNFILIETNEGMKVLVLDWQDMSIGRGPTDVDFFLSSSMSIEDRRMHEKALLKLYYDTLGENGVANYTFDQCWDDYRMAMFEILWRYVLLFGLRILQGAAYTEGRDVFGPRVFAAVVDLNSRETLTRLGS